MCGQRARDMSSILMREEFYTRTLFHEDGSTQFIASFALAEVAAAMQMRAEQPGTAHGTAHGTAALTLWTCTLSL